MLNLVYIRAAIRENTGYELTLERIRDLLLEEGLITRQQASDPELIFKNYDDYYYTEEASREYDRIPMRTLFDSYKKTYPIKDE